MIYVDDMRMAARVGKLTAVWSHMFSDTSTDELDEWAERLRLSAYWLQNSHGFLHYDLVEHRRQLALKLGAVPISYSDLPNYVYRLNPPGTRREVTTFLVEGLSCQRSGIVVSQPT